MTEWLHAYVGRVPNSSISRINRLCPALQGNSGTRVKNNPPNPYSPFMITIQLYSILHTFCSLHIEVWAGWLSRYSDWLRAGRSGDRIPVGGEIFLTCPDRLWGPPSLLYNGYRVFFPGVKSGRGVTLTSHTLLVPWSRKGRAIPLPPPL